MRFFKKSPEPPHVAQFAQPPSAVNSPMPSVQLVGAGSEPSQLAANQETPDGHSLQTYPSPGWYRPELASSAPVPVPQQISAPLSSTNPEWVRILEHIHSGDVQNSKDKLDDEDETNNLPALKTRKSSSKRDKPSPPAALVASFGPVNDPSGLLTPLPKDEPKETGEAENENSNEAESFRPTCSLNLVCYRSEGCTIRQIRVVNSALWKERYGIEYVPTNGTTPAQIASDKQLFLALRHMYRTQMCSFWRRYLYLKTLRRLRLLAYTTDSRPVPVPFDDITMQEVFWAYNNPSSFGDDETEWVEWVFRLRQPDKRHALEFVEGWNGARIAVLGTLPCVVSTLVGVIWSVLGGDIQTAFTVAGFILTVATVLLALLAVISGIDSSKLA